MNDKTKIRWYKRDPDAALNGMVGLNLEQRGAYNTIIDLFYSRDGDVPDDDDFICNHLKCNRQRWRRLRTELMELGKLHVNSGTFNKPGRK